MLTTRYFRKIILGVFIVQMLLTQVFAVDYMKLGRTSSYTSTIDNNGTFWQKAYCGSGYYYSNISHAGSGIQELSMVMRYASGYTTLTTGSFAVASFDGWNWHAYNVSSMPTIINSSSTGINGYALLDPGDFYFQVNKYTSNPDKYLTTSDINFLNFVFTNNFGVSGTTLKLNYETGANNLFPVSTIVSAASQNILPDPYDYLVNVKFIPEPCTVDSDQPQFISTTPATAGFMPLKQDQLAQAGGLWGAKIDSGVFFGITEPAGTTENFMYSGGDAGQGIGNPGLSGVVDPLTTDYTGGYGTATNQRGINTGSVKIYLNYTGVARGTINQKGTGIAITRIFSGSDLIFTYLTGAGSRTWDQNYKGAYVSVNSAVITALPEFRKETVAYIGFTGQDWNNSLPNVVNISGTVRNNPNILYNNAGIGGSASTNSWYGYAFNSGTNNAPTAQLAKSGPATGTNNVLGSVITTNTRTTISNQQISGGQTQFHFRFMDNRAGISGGSIKVTVAVFTATNTLTASYANPSGVGISYLFSGVDVNLFSYSGAADTDDFTGYVDISGKLPRSLITGDRVKVTLYAEDYVGNIVTNSGTFDMQDYPPAPPAISKNFIMENGQTIAQVLGSNWYISGDSLYNSYTGAYGMILSGVTYNGQSSIELTGYSVQDPGNASGILYGIFLSGGVLYGTAQVESISGFRDFYFTGLMRNIYNQTGYVSIYIQVAPSCSDAAGCGPQIKIYTGTTLADVSGKVASATGWTWYNNRFVKISSTDRPTWTGTATNAILMCGGSGSTTVTISNLNYPAITNAPFTELYSFTGTTLYVSGDSSYAGMSGIIYRTGVIYVFRNLTGGIQYVTGQYLTGTLINWTRDAVVTGTITVTGGYITGDNVGIFAGPAIELGGGRKIYTYASDITGFDILIENRWNTSGDTYEPAFYRTGVLTFNNSWIDRQAPIFSSTGSSCQSPSTGTITLISQATGYGYNFTGNLTYLNTTDDEFVITAITTGTNFVTGNNSSGNWIYDIVANSGTYLMTGTILFTGNWSGYVHVQDRAGNTGYVFVETTCIQGAQVTVYAIPGYRESGNYDFTGTVAVYTLTGSPLSGTYYSSYTGSFNTAGTGLFTLPRPLYGQTIGVVLHTSMHLPAMGFTGTLTETGTTFFDFTIRTGRGQQYVTSGWFDYVNLGSIGIRSLLVPGDVLKSDNVGTGSIINAFDMATINANLTLDSATKYPQYDFDDKDGIISSFEQAVIIQNLQRQGWDLDLDKFEGLIYTGF